MKGRRKVASRGAPGGMKSFFVALAAITAVVAAGLFAFDAFLAGGKDGGEQDELLAPVSTEGPGTHDVASTTGGPDVHFATTSADFGVVPLNTEVGHAFSFANVGDKRLEIEDVSVAVLEGC